MVPSMIWSLVTKLTNSTWLGTRYLVSKFLLNFHKSGINARMPIQSSQVRGGTLISLPFFSFFPLSLCLSSAIFSKCSAQANTAFPDPQHGITAPPSPFQSAEGSLVELETLSNSQAFHPEQFSLFRGGHNQLMSCGPWNFLVGEKVLQFHLRTQADRLKPVARSPMSHKDTRTNFVCVEVFHTGGECRRSLCHEPRGNDFPADFHSGEDSVPAAAVQLD